MTGASPSTVNQTLRRSGQREKWSSPEGVGTIPQGSLAGRKQQVAGPVASGNLTSTDGRLVSSECRSKMNLLGKPVAKYRKEHQNTVVMELS